MRGNYRSILLKESLLPVFHTKTAETYRVILALFALQPTGTFLRTMLAGRLGCDTLDAVLHMNVLDTDNFFREAILMCCQAPRAHMG